MSNNFCVVEITITQNHNHHTIWLSLCSEPYIFLGTNVINYIIKDCDTFFPVSEEEKTNYSNTFCRLRHVMGCIHWRCIWNSSSPSNEVFMHKIFKVCKCRTVSVETWIMRHYSQNASFDSDDMSEIYTCLIALHF